MTLTVNTPMRGANVTVTGGTTDGAVVAANTNRKIRVLAASITGGTAAATTAQFTTKPAGAGTAITPVIPLAANGTVVLPFNDGGWFETAVGEGLSVTTGAGAAVGVLLTYSLV